MAIGQLRSVALDCADPGPLAAFWAEVVGGKLVFQQDDFTVVQAGGLYLVATRVAGYRPPSWPEDAVPKQIHLDVAVADLDAAETAAVALGARRVAHQPAPDRWRVLLDPSGHPFCLSTQIPEPR
ncbi:VOC family protein [Streptomyces sp. B1866]|uniref:VOC family protein n=1 Tax=Streptomyces sp. B1866 TaxID=3075431 RepID=UPI00288D661F|nr:VOC family protein [Streptomyces sp. B1866]MDT3396119.1 VOC family protein [Streptomyces sp. B1866]